MNRTVYNKTKKTNHSFAGILTALFLCTICLFYVAATPAHAEPDSETTEDTSSTETLYTTEYPADSGQAPDLVSNAAIVMDASSGTILYQKNASDTHYPASITKIMTCLLALEHTNLTDTITMSHDSIYGMEWDCSRVGLMEGEQISMEDALYGMMLESGNEAAWAIGEAVAQGTIDDFAVMMNEKAASLGCQNTHFVNANGLHDDNHYTTCYDMALITKEALTYDMFRTLTSTQNYVIAATNTCEEERSLWQHCKMIYKNSKYYYEYCEGGKTGYTTDALNTLVTWSKKDGLELICVVMNCSGGGCIYTDSIALYNYCFNNYTVQTPLSDYTFTNDQTSEALSYLNTYYNTSCDADITLQISNDYALPFSNSEDLSQITYSIVYNEVPVETDSEYEVGQLVLSYNGESIGQTPITVTGYTVAEPAAVAQATEALSQTTAPAQTNERRTIPLLFILLSVVAALVLFFLLYILWLNHARKRQRMRQLARRKQYEEQRKKMLDAYDTDIDIDTT